MLLRVVIVIVIAGFVGTVTFSRTRSRAIAAGRRGGTPSLSERCHDLVVEGGSTHGLGGLVATGAGLVLLALLAVPDRFHRTGRETRPGS